MHELDRYRGTAVRDIVCNSLSYGSETDPLVLLMGPYRLLDPDYLYAADGFDLPPDPLAPSRPDTDPDSIETTLRTIAKRVTERTGATLFLASDVEIPTRTEVARTDRDEPGMAVIDQSVACARASDGNAFVFTKAGLTTGVGAEAGAIPEHFSLRSEMDRTRDPRTFCFFSEAERTDDDRNTYEPKFSSASIDEMDDAYEIRFRYFADRTDLVDKLIGFVDSYVVPMAD